MNFNDEFEDALHGRTHSDGGCFEFDNASKEYVLNRFEYLENLVEGKTLIHVGCVDTPDALSWKMTTDRWLHARLAKKAARCVGIDISQIGIEHLKERYGIEDIYCLDLMRDDLSIAGNQSWDLIILGEMLEHLDNPVEFLASLRSKIVDKVSRVVVTVPNAMTIYNWRGALNHREQINTDHRYWFTPYTLAKVVTRAGYRVEDIRFVLCDRDEAYFRQDRFRNHFWRWLLRRYPMLRGDLVLTASCDSQLEKK